MTPEVKKIGNKLFEKVELSSVKVELGLVDDIVKDKEKYSKSVISGNAKTNVVVDNAKLAIAFYQQAIKDYNFILTQVNGVKKQAEQLGVDVPTKINQVEQEVKNSITYMDKRIKNLTASTQVMS